MGDKCAVCLDTGETDGALGFNGYGPCPRCSRVPPTWGAYELRGEWYVLRAAEEIAAAKKKPAEAG